VTRFTRYNYPFLSLGPMCQCFENTYTAPIALKLDLNPRWHRKRGQCPGGEMVLSSHDSWELLQLANKRSWNLETNRSAGEVIILFKRKLEPGSIWEAKPRYIIQKICWCIFEKEKNFLSLHILQRSDIFMQDIKIMRNQRSLVVKAEVSCCVLVEPFRQTEGKLIPSV
jgi:hypothetical protein